MDFETYDMSFDGDYESDASDDETDDEDNFSDDEFDEDEEPVEKKTSESRQVRLIKSMVRKLDAMMVLVLRYLSKYAINSTNAERTEMYNTLLNLFDQQIVMTLKSRYTQFLLFYFSSLEVNVFPEHFIDHLFESMNDSSRPGIIRIACAAYISSYVARAKVLDSDGVQRAINTLCNWCYTYLDQLDDSALRPDPTKHDMFYAVMQAIMYIFCFRWRDLVVQDNDFEAQEDEESQSNSPEEENALDKVPMIVIGNGTRKWCRGLRNIGVLLQSKLNPLKVCSPMVVQQFAKIASETDLVYVHAMLESNKNIFISGVTAGASDGSKGKHILATVQSFFPFDPYNLKSSQHFIQDIYLEWIADDDDDEEDDSSDDEENESDEEEQAMEQGMSAMSISPVAPQFMSLS